MFLFHVQKKLSLPWKTGETPKMGCSFSSEKHSPKKQVMDIVKNFVEKKLQQQRQTLETRRGFCVNTKTWNIFGDFALFLHLFVFFFIFLRFFCCFLFFFFFFFFFSCFSNFSFLRDLTLPWGLTFGLVLC